MVQHSQQYGSDVLRITMLDEEVKILEFIPAVKKSLSTKELIGEGKALGELLNKILPRDTLHALRAYLV